MTENEFLKSKIGDWISVITLPEPVQIDGVRRQKVKDGWYNLIFVGDKSFLPEHCIKIDASVKGK